MEKQKESVGPFWRGMELEARDYRWRQDSHYSLSRGRHHAICSRKKEAAVIRREPFDYPTIYVDYVEPNIQEQARIERAREIEEAEQWSKDRTSGCEPDLGTLPPVDLSTS